MKPIKAKVGALGTLWKSRSSIIAAMSLVAILAHLVMRFALHTTEAASHWPLFATLVLGGIPMLRGDLPRSRIGCDDERITIEIDIEQENKLMGVPK